MDEPGPRYAVRETRHHVTDPHLFVHVVADLQAPGVGEDHVAAVKPAGVDAEINVAHPGAEAQKYIGALHDVAHLPARDAALVNTDCLRMVLGDDGLAEQSGCDRYAARLDEAAELRHQAVAMQLDAAENHRAACGQKQAHGLVKRLGECIRVGRWPRWRREGPGHGAGPVDHIGRDLDHDWPLLGDAAGERAVDALRGLRRIV